MKKISILFAGLLLISSLSLNVSSLTVAPVPFTDVDKYDLFADAVDYLQGKWVVQGYEDGSFGYDKKINRAEFLKIAIEAKLLTKNKEFMNSYTDEGCFDDVEADKWYTGYICYAKEKKWIKGYSDDTFKPGDDINFVEAAKIVYAVFGGKVKDTSPWYKAYVEPMGQSNLIPLTIAEFTHKMTRGEMADMIVRRMMFDEGELVDFLGEEKFNINVNFETIKNGEDMARYLLVDDPFEFPYDTEENTETLKFERGVLKYALSGQQEFHDLFASKYNNVVKSLSSGAFLTDKKTVIYTPMVGNHRIHFSMYEYVPYSKSDIYPSDNGGPKGKMISKIVQYDIADQEIKTVLKFETENEEATYLRLMAVDFANGKYIVAAVPYDWSPGPCSFGWLFDRDWIYEIDMNDSAIDLDKNYEIPSWKETEAMQETDQCLIDEGLMDPKLNI